MDIKLLVKGAYTQIRSFAEAEDRERRLQVKDCRRFLAVSAIATTLTAIAVMTVPGLKPLAGMAFFEAVAAGNTLIAGTVYMTVSCICGFVYIALLLMVPTSIAMGRFGAKDGLTKKMGVFTGLTIETAWEYFPVVSYLLITVFSLSVVFYGWDGLWFVLGLLLPNSTAEMLLSAAFEAFLCINLYISFRKVCARVKDYAHEKVHGEKPVYRDSALGKHDAKIKHEMSFIKMLYK